MYRVKKFRVWTGKRMLYQDTQYLASFIRRVVPEIILDHGGETFSQHEAYLPNGGVLDKYLLEWTGLKDTHGIEIYEGDVLAYGNNRGLIKDICTWQWLQIEDEEGNVVTDNLLDTLTKFVNRSIKTRVDFVISPAKKYCRKWCVRVV